MPAAENKLIPRYLGEIFTFFGGILITRGISYKNLFIFSSSIVGNYLKIYRSVFLIIILKQLRAFISRIAALRYNNDITFRSVPGNSFRFYFLVPLILNVS